MSACSCHDCPCNKICVIIPQFKVYNIGMGSELVPDYYASHLNVGAVDEIFHLPVGKKDGQVHLLRLVSSGGGRALIDTDNLATFNQVQLNTAGSYVKLIWFKIVQCLISVGRPTKLLANKSISSSSTQ